MSSNLNEENVGGYSVAYSRDDTYFPIYVLALVTAIFVVFGDAPGPLAIGVVTAFFDLLPELALLGGGFIR